MERVVCGDDASGTVENEEGLPRGFQHAFRTNIRQRNHPVKPWKFHAVRSVDCVRTR
jgi:hypothetical protein